MIKGRARPVDQSLMPQVLEGKKVQASESPIAVLADAVQRLASAKETNDVHAIIRSAARNLTGADGATFVHREGSICFYADEDAIAPLWKGRRYPINQCIAGWAMLNRQSVAIADIYSDKRISRDVYWETFVKSLTIVPIRSVAPIGAIGCYWSHTHIPHGTEISALQSLADAAGVALQNVSSSESMTTEPISGLNNRRGFFTIGGALLVANRERDLDTIVVCADLTGLNEINETHGYAIGDDALRFAGSALQRVFGESAVIGRIRGDQFAICSSSDFFDPISPDDLELAIRYACPESEHPVTMTVGIAQGAPSDDLDLDSLITEADTLMYERKHGADPPPDRIAGRENFRRPESADLAIEAWANGPDADD
jgi:diguanylate cyclase (GGDEF)-like protein